MRTRLIQLINAVAFSAASIILPASSYASGHGEIDKSSDPVLDNRPMLRADVPEPLKSWVPWVLKDQLALNCPFSYNKVEDRRCVWPEKISLVLRGKAGGTFKY